MDGWMGGWVDGWMGGWMDGRAGLRIAYSNQNANWRIVLASYFILNSSFKYNLKISANKFFR